MTAVLKIREKIVKIEAGKLSVDGKRIGKLESKTTKFGTKGAFVIISGAQKILFKEQASSVFEAQEFIKAVKSVVTKWEQAQQARFAAAVKGQKFMVGFPQGPPPTSSSVKLTPHSLLFGAMRCSIPLGKIKTINVNDNGSIVIAPFGIILTTKHWKKLSDFVLIVQEFLDTNKKYKPLDLSFIKFRRSIKQIEGNLTIKMKGLYLDYHSKQLAQKFTKTRNIGVRRVVTLSKKGSRNLTQSTLRRPHTTITSSAGTPLPQRALTASLFLDDIPGIRSKKPSPPTTPRFNATPCQHKGPSSFTDSRMMTFSTDETQKESPSKVNLLTEIQSLKQELQETKVLLSETVSQLRSQQRFQQIESAFSSFVRK